MVRGLILDLDGTIYVGVLAVAGAAQFIADMRARQVRCLFVTNRSNRPPDAIAEQLSGLGIPCMADDVLTSSQALTRHLKPGSAYVIGGEGLVQQLGTAGFTFRDEGPDYVIVGIDREFTYQKLKLACRAILGGAQFIATNPDRIIILEDGINPGAGAIVGAIQAVTETPPLVIGKPERILYDIALEILGMERDEVLAVGDNLATDIVAGEKAGLRTVLMLTGLSTRADSEASPVKPTWIAASFDELAQHIALDGLPGTVPPGASRTAQAAGHA